MLEPICKPGYVPLNGVDRRITCWNVFRGAATKLASQLRCAQGTDNFPVGTEPAESRDVDTSSFTPVASLVGGLLIGTSASLMLLSLGRIAGISGIVGGLFAAPPGDRAWRWMFGLGLLFGGVGLAAGAPERFSSVAGHGIGRLVVAGLLVGIGTRIGGGCTSGHGVCGIARLSKRSLVATAVFMSTAMVTVAIFGGAR